METNIYPSIKKYQRTMQSFQYKILNRSLNCSYNLAKWKVIHDTKYNYCTFIDTLDYSLYYCHASIEFSDKVSKWIKQITDVKKRFSVCDINFGLTNRLYNGDRVDFTINYLVLLGKWFLNKQKSKIKKIQNFLY